MRRLELTFLHFANGGGCSRWRDEDSAYLRSEHDPRPEVRRSEGQCRRGSDPSGHRKITARDPSVRRTTPPPIQQCRLSELPHHVLHVECVRCFRGVEIQKAVQSGSMGHMPSGRTSGSDGSTRPAQIAQVATRKTDAGQTGLVNPSGSI